MEFKEFTVRREQIEKQSVARQKEFYEQIVRNKYDKTEVRVHACFYYGQLFYQEGNFRKTIDIIEPIVVDYQSYPYTTKLLSCFNLMGVATHCEAEYNVSRFFYETALHIAMENDETYYYAFEYNNIALTYIEEAQYDEAIRYLKLAEDALQACDEDMGAYVYINKSIALRKQGHLTAASEAFETATGQYRAGEVIPDDVARSATTLYYRLGQTEKYEQYKDQVLQKLDVMHAAEFMEACRELFTCGMDAGDEKLLVHILQSMQQYMEKHPEEIIVGLVFAGLKYSYAEYKADTQAILAALKLENTYKDQIIAHAKESREKTIKQYMEIHAEIMELEQDALTGFKNRKAYYKDIAVIEHNDNMRKRPVGVVFADVNGLKKINDSKGHEAGDELIAAVAGKIREAFPKDSWYRFGGDEFLILSFDKKEAVFQQKLKKLAGIWDDGCSASIGSVWLTQATDIEQNVSRADALMYRDKSLYYAMKVHDRRTHAYTDTEESLKKIEAASELLPGGFFVYYADEKEQLITYNQEILKIYECQTEEEFLELTGNSFKGMVYPDDLSIVETDISGQISQERDIDRVQYRIICKDGSVKKVLDCGRFVHTELYGDVYYVFMNEISE